MFVKLRLLLLGDISIRIYSEASIAENPLLAAAFVNDNKKLASY
jgi:hypothetical protein